MLHATADLTAFGMALEDLQIDHPLVLVIGLVG